MLKNGEHKKLKLTLITLFVIAAGVVFLFFYMGFNVKYDLRCQVNSYLATPTKRNHRILKKISAN
ncbi:hypothetical protein LDI01_13410 [Lentilactobacillus diolivorans]|uniref:Uncharacterized protein n=1 Tax=Lentilactobacillus diolivorans TaxID=179838 RepID=A0ABQ0XEF9_9LACO|nr:hypothetical protein LDI01_13410 [Lentilactobacillus diolivorans]